MGSGGRIESSGDAEIAVTVTESKRPPKEMYGWTMAMLYLVGGIVSLALFDHLGLEQSSTGQIQDGVNRVVADWYEAKPSRPRRSDTGDPPKVALVLWDDADLTDTTWPVPYGKHAEVLGRIAEGKPRGVLIDLLFADKRPEFDLLPPAIAAFRQSRSQVYLVNAGGCSDAGVVPELLQLTEPSSDPNGLPRIRKIATPVPAPRKDDAIDGVTREYYLFADRGAQEDGPLRRECATAALRMHLDDTREEVDLESYREPLVLWWGSSREASSWWQLARRFGDWFAGHLEREKTPERERGLRRDRWNLPFDVYSAREVLDSEFDPTVALGGRFVVYGTEFIGASDDIATAIHEERVPGAVAHAMAFDNLQRSGVKYVRRLMCHKVPLIGNVPKLDAILLVLGAIAFPLIIPWKDRATSFLAEKASDGRYSPAERTGSALLFLFSCWLLPTPLVALVGVVLVVWPPLGTAFFVVFLSKLVLPFLLAATAGTVAFWRWGAAPVNFAAHVFVWLAVSEIVDVVKEIQPEPDPVVHATFAARIRERFRAMRAISAPGGSDLSPIERSDS